MSDDKNTLPNAPLGGANQNPNSNGNPSVGNITRIPISPTKPEAKPIVEGPDFFKRAQAFESAAGGIVDILGGVSYKFLDWKASRIITDKSDRKDTLEPSRLSPKTQEAMEGSLSRILARHCDSTEAADWTVVAGGVAELAGGYMIVCKRIDALEAKLIAAAKKEAANGK